MAKSKVTPPTQKKAAAKKSPRPADNDSDLDTSEITGSQEDYERFLAEAQALAERDVRPFRLDASVAYHNVQRGVDAVLPLSDRIRQELPSVNLEQLRALPNVSLALCFAVSQVDRDGASSKQLAEPLKRTYALRETMLASALALGLAGTLPKREVEKIQEGRGALDAAQDCVDLAALFKKHAAAVRGKSPVTAAQVTEAARLGTDLIKVLRPRSVKKDRRPTGALKDAVDVRDRLATIVSTRHELLRRVGHWLWGDAVDQHVPALQARAVQRRKKGAGGADKEKKKTEKGEP